ncbi:helix-turn-helix domain-containing protein [Mycobacterium kansasii]|uniref:helix-turn-helix domain-containing protein n=1 Tax=Mycobacterium kansasii TaxID=1768 RepID=UPI00115CDC08|nr:helix-turn-helix domain-containing protein [Mycobacterium kansasii]
MGMISGTENTPAFARFLKDTREYFRFSQQSVADAGGPHRQLQAALEKGDEPEVSSAVLCMFDQAYGWPVGYTQAVAELGAYQQTFEQPLALAADEHDRRALLDYRDQPEYVVGSATKTFAALYRHAERDSKTGAAYLGFCPDTGKPCYLEGPVLTNLGFDVLYPMVLARHGVTTIDSDVADDETLSKLWNLTLGHMAEGLGQNKVEWFRIGTNRPEVASASPIAIDPLLGITTLSEAKLLAAELLRIRPHVPTTPLQAGYTFLAVVAFGEDTFATLTELKRQGSDPYARDFDARFTAFWKKFYDPAAGPDVAEPDRFACDLLGGVMFGRSNGMEMSIGYYSGQRYPRYDFARTVSQESLMDADRPPAIVVYDGKCAPELPTVQSSQWKTRALTFYNVDLDSTGVLHPTLGRYPYMRVGITSADDRAILAHRDPEIVGTLTHRIGRQAIYCSSNRAQRVWIPGR